MFNAETLWVSDIEPAAQRIEAARFPNATQLGDATKVDWATVPPVDILTGGFPCQDLSHAGRQAGLVKGTTRSGLWGEMVRAAAALRPQYIIAENVRGLLSGRTDSTVEPCPWCVGDGQPPGGAMRAFGVVLGDLADLGYDAQWCSLRASDVGACHQRFRVFILASDPNRPIGQRDRFPTPSETASRGARANVGGSGGNLLPTPTARDWKGNNQRHDATCLPGALELTEFGQYTEAVARWATVTGTPPPAATEPTPTGHRLSPRFTEWMMGLPAGWVTDIPGLSRAAQLKALGNGVVPQQAAAALAWLVDTAREDTPQCG